MIKPLGSRLLIEEVRGALTTTASGIIIGDERVPQSIRAKVIATGPDCKLIKVGDVVFIGQFAPTECRENASQKTMICPEEDVLAVVESDKAAK